MFLRRRSTSTQPDEELVARARSGNRASLGSLWDRYAHLLFGVAMKYLKDAEAAKDLVMDLFSDLPALMGKHEVRSFRPWVHAVVRNRCLMLLRKADPQASIGAEPVAEEDDMVVLKEASLQALEAAITRLPAGQAQCIRQFYLERNSYQQVAERTGLPVEQVRSHLQNGRRNLRIIMERHGHTH